MGRDGFAPIRQTCPQGREFLGQTVGEQGVKAT